MNYSFQSIARQLFFLPRHYWLMLAITVIFQFPLVLPGMGMPQWGDFYCFHSPNRIAMAGAVHGGHMPFITQAIFGGYPLYSDPQFAFFYPLNLLFALAVPNPNSEIALDAYVLVNLIALSLSALFFVRSFRFARTASVAGSLIVSMNGFVVMHITHINILQVMATGLLAGGLLARLAWSDGRRWRFALGASLALAAGNLAGHPQTSMFLHYALGAGMITLSFIMWRHSRTFASVVRILGWSAVAVVMGVVMAAIQLLPTAHLLSISTRILMGPFEAMDEAIILKNLPSMLFPGFYFPLGWTPRWPFYIPPTIQWLSANPLEALTFFGLTAFALGLLGFLGHLKKPGAHVLFWGALLLVAASTGSQTPVYPFLYDWLPGVKVVRVPSRVLWMFYTAWGLLAAAGIELLIRRETARVAALWTAVCVGGLVLGAVVVVLVSYQKTWLDTLTNSFVAAPERFDAVIRAAPEIFLGAFWKQVLFGCLFLFCILAALIKGGRRGGSYALAVFVVAMMSVELFAYGFARSYIVDHPPTGKVVCDPFLATPEIPSGRLNVPHFVHGGGATNIAMVQGLQIPGGYSVTYPAWVKAFELFDVPPWRSGLEEKLLDIWNVSDIVLRKRLVPARIGPFDAAPVDDWGWTEIGTAWKPGTGVQSVSGRALMPVTLSINLDEITTPVVQMYSLLTAASTLTLSDGTEIARMSAVPHEDSETSIAFPLRLGTELSDSRYSEEVRRGGKPAHSQVEIAYTRDALWEWSDGAQMYAAHHPLPRPLRLKRLTVEATGPFPAVFGLNQVFLVLSDGSIVAKAPLEVGDFKLADSSDPRYHLLHRDTNPGYAAMVPSAIRGSYKDPDNIVWRMLHANFKPQLNVIVDKQTYGPEPAAALDAANPALFEGTAEIEWKQPEELVVHTKSNDRGWLSLSMTWDKGWSATVDGEPVELGRGNGPHCALPLPAGEHEVRLKYTPVHFWWGAVFSAATFAGVCGAGLWGYRRRPRAGV